MISWVLKIVFFVMKFVSINLFSIIFLLSTTL